MKKLLVLVGILAAFSLMGCPKDPKDPVNPPASDPIENPAEPETPAAPVVITYTDDITIADNHNQYGNNFQVNIGCLKDIQLKAGEKVKVEFKADITREKVVNTIKGNFVDTSAAAGYWTVLNDPTDVVILDGEGDKINFTGIFEITKDATAKGANYFVIYTDGAAEDGEPKLSNVELKLTIGTQLPEEDGDEGDKEPEAPAFDGNVDLTKLAEYDETAGGLVKDFGKAVNGYDVAFTYKLSDLGYTDEDFTKIEIIADIYNGDEKYDLGDSNYDEAKWNRRIMATNGTEKEYNMGVKGFYIPFTSATDEILIQIKGEPVTKVVITAINFVK